MVAENKSSISGKQMGRVVIRALEVHDAFGVVTGVATAIGES